MIWLLCFVVVAASCGVLLAALLANPRDPLLAKRKPYGCSCCHRTWDSLSAFYAHRCVCERVR